MLWEAEAPALFYSNVGKGGSVNLQYKKGPVVSAFKTLKCIDLDITIPNLFPTLSKLRP